jgi:hypothetical protein
MYNNLQFLTTEKDNCAVLLKKYNQLKRAAYHSKKFIKEYDVLQAALKLDIPRTFVKSKFFSKPINQDKAREVLFVFSTYSNLRYLQGMLYLLVPLLQLYEGSCYCAFWAFVDFTELIRPLYLRICLKEYTERQCEVTERVMALYCNCRSVKNKENELEMLRLLLQTKFITTLFFSLLSDLNSAPLLMQYFLQTLNSKKKFYGKLQAFSFALLLSVLPEQELTIEAVQKLSTCTLSNEALESILYTSKHAEVLFR